MDEEIKRKILTLMDTPQIMEIAGLSMAAHAQPVTDRAKAAKVLRMLPLNILSRSRCHSRCRAQTTSAFSA